MLNRRFVLALLLALTLGPLSWGQDLSQMGRMWTFENAPKDYFEKQHGFKLTQEWLDSVRMASLRFGGGCSSSFVSPQGLIMTNHHCARGDIAKASPADEDWGKNGYVAKTLADEVKMEGLTVQQLIAMTDVTDEVNAGIADDDDSATIAEKRKANKERLLAKSRSDNPAQSPKIIELYQGGMYQLYEYRIFDDIRLVVAPHLQTAHFGGDHDNFTYPRFGIDFTFCRAYVDGKPYDSSKSYFKFKTSGAKEGESVFVTGSPGSTSRLETLAQLRYNRDVYYPIILPWIDAQLDQMRRASKRSAAQEKRLRTRILSFENAQKAFGGYYAGLKDASLMAAKESSEKDFRAKVDADPELKKKFASAWSRIEELAAEQKALFPARYFNTDLQFSLLARAQVLLSAQNDEDLAERADRAKTIPVGKVNAALIANIKKARHWLGAEEKSMLTLLGNADNSVEDGLKAFTAKTTLGTDDGIDALVALGVQGIRASEDPAIVVMLHNRKTRTDSATRLREVQAELKVQTTRVGQALFALHGTKVSPDATGSLRISDGIVKGFDYNGTIAPYYTSFYGLYARNTEFGNVYPFDLPQIWLDRRDKIDMTRAVDFVSTNDIIGGNSGSPIINRNREVVGLIFDGNIEMLSNKYMFRDEVSRSVSVHTEAIMEAISKIYDADRTVKELLGK